MRKYRGAGLAGIASTNEQFGALVAALLAREMASPERRFADVCRNVKFKRLARIRFSAGLDALRPGP